MKNSVIIAASGTGKRMKSAVAKQYLELKGRTVLSYTVEVFEKSESINEIVIVCGENDIAFVKKEIVEKYDLGKVKAVVAGGKERQDSVYNGLKAVSPDCDIVLIHDGVRPFVENKHIKPLINAAYEYGGCVLGVRVKDTVKVCDENGIVTDTPSRDALWAAQTPQCFKYDVIMKAYEKAFEDNYYGTDDSMLAERTGVKIKMVEGSYNNIKLTTPEDIDLGEKILEKR